MDPDVIDKLTGLGLLSTMITPAVLISACGALIFSTSTRLARVVDRVRHLSQQIEQLYRQPPDEVGDARRREIEVQLRLYVRRSKLVQQALTSLYLSLGLFVASTIAIGATAFVAGITWVPSALGIAGTLFLFAGSVLLIGETRLALRALSSEMAFTLRITRQYLAQHQAPGRDEAMASLDRMSDEVTRKMPGGRQAGT
jgi:hypothetical protein